ncbi:ORF55 [Ostreid herpesvirus 1]|uniref:Uncharacterized protein ORF55 n=1 Tax=Ostreid herpesvirus 1 (isolate France) TaxID=654903 RepID=Y055_OSHVF|nr:ORF55 [Ostreid herpesvirus 1]Q6R7H0.1 RecName: Full=Uncharacterized protein ORF55 [Ostreid herpesvirus 1 (isolate France)]AAS00945.1 ORF55 [Ostreid herpesvirus 1]AKM20992.1 ORF55 [Ostreid herpesvirus 1]ASK05582.1 ORF55 [Ostreid herpesvirus 1]ASK05713.1 ORF55 [Ostreid herpesvirus 1]AVL26982.1 ORF55 [Ostreid herpesvirus 1]
MAESAKTTLQLIFGNLAINIDEEEYQMVWGDVADMRNLFLERVPAKDISEIENLEKKDVKFIVDTLDKVLMSNNLYSLEDPAKNPPSLEELYNPTALLLDKVVTPECGSGYKFLVSLTEEDYTAFLFMMYYLEGFLSEM